MNINPIKNNEMDLNKLFKYKDCIMVFSRIKDGFIIYESENRDNQITMWGYPKRGLELTKEMTVEKLYQSLENFNWI